MYFEGIVWVHAGLSPKQVPPSNVLRLEFVKATLLYQISAPSFRTQSNLLYKLWMESGKEKAAKKRRPRIQTIIILVGSSQSSIVQES